tara:strand:- start:2068 stop:3156 length:1089 start_codon:yes stop_codon:yes gene_type:complete
MQSPAHSKFPTNDNAFSKKSNPDVETYIKRFNDGKWKLHNIQRNDSTWKDSEYALTIQSILEGTLLSPFIASLQENGHDTFLIDGGHRTRAILRFMNDDFPVKISRTGNTSFYSELEVSDRHKFLSSELSVITWSKLTKLDEETLFFRVNVGLCLSGGEAVNAYHTIPICVLARKLAEKYADVLHDSINRATLKKNERHDASSWMFLLLSNFHNNEITRGENYGRSMFEDQKEDCENFRDVAIDEECLTRKIDFLMNILSTKTVTKKLPTYIMPTIQAIMLESNAFPSRFQNSAKLINHFLFDMFEIDTSTTPNALVTEWNSYSRKYKSNPGEPGYCVNRAHIFFEWKRQHEIDSLFKNYEA